MLARAPSQRQAPSQPGPLTRGDPQPAAALVHEVLADVERHRFDDGGLLGTLVVLPTEDKTTG
ncbi:hypothetical protein GCM10010245_79920 [Streptomyces spectabilis]|nr:hypothetical protein GCM10010245_79920 [Streptomyces spectabilis]